MKSFFKEKYCWLIVAVVFVDLFVCGGIFFGSSGIFIVPVCKSLKIGQGNFSMYLTIQSFTIAAAVIIAPKLLEKFKYKTLNAASSVIAGSGFVAMSFAKDVVLLYVGGVMIGCGCVFLTYLIAGTLLPKWFKKELGIAIAIGTSGIGLGGVVFNPLISYLISLNGILGFSEGWRFAYFFLGLLVILICLPIALFIIKDRPEEIELKPYGYESSSVERDTSLIQGVKKETAIKSSSFIFYALMVICFTLPGAIMTYLPALVANGPISNISSIIGSVGMFGSILGGFLIGKVNDKKGAHIGGVFAGACGVAGFILLMMGGSMSFMMLIGAALYGIFYQVNQVQMPAMVSELYGELDYDRIFPVAASISPWIGAVSYSLWGFLFDLTHSYNIMLIVGLSCGILTAITGVIAYLLSRKLPVDTVNV